MRGNAVVHVRPQIKLKHKLRTIFSQLEFLHSSKSLCDYCATNEKCIIQMNKLECEMDLRLVIYKEFHSVCR